MDYETMTNEELIKLAKEGRHLKSAVEAKDKEINRLKSESEDLRKNLKNEYEKEINDLKQRLKNSESNIEILSDKKLSDLRNSLERNEKQLKQDIKTASEIAFKKSKELEEALDLIKSIQRSFQGSLDMSISLANYFEDKVMKGE